MVAFLTHELEGLLACHQTKREGDPDSSEPDSDRKPAARPDETSGARTQDRQGNHHFPADSRGAGNCSGHHHRQGDGKQTRPPGSWKEDAEYQHPRGWKTETCNRSPWPNRDGHFQARGNLQEHGGPTGPRLRGDAATQGETKNRKGYLVRRSSVMVKLLGNLPPGPNQPAAPPKPPPTEGGKEAGGAPTPPPGSSHHNGAPPPPPEHAGTQGGPTQGPHSHSGIPRNQVDPPDPQPSQRRSL